MKFIKITQAGGPEVLRLSETQQPELDKGQVLIKVAAAGVNRLDLLQLKGIYRPPPGTTEIPGVEVAGEVVKVADDCGQIKEGDRVCALLTGGGYAEYVQAESKLCLPIPSGWDEIEAASLPEALFTVWTNVFDIANLRPGESFLVHGGSSGIGTAAIQMAKAFDARVFTTAGSDKKCEYCKSLGADVAINYNTQDFVSRCLAETRDNGINVILDMVGGTYLNKNIQISSTEGRIVMIAAMQGYNTEVDLLSIMKKRLILTGSTLRSRSVEFKAPIAIKLLERIWPKLETRTINPNIYETFPIDQAEKAHRLMESSEHCGKIVLVLE